jgi:hypothetical protein
VVNAILTPPAEKNMEENMSMTLRESYLASKPAAMVVEPSPDPIQKAQSQQVSPRSNKGPQNGDGCARYIGQRVLIVTAGNQFSYLGKLVVVNVYTLELRREDTGNTVLLFKSQLLSLEEASS